MAVDYERVSPQAPQGTPPEALHKLLHRAMLAEVLLREGRVS